MTLSELMTNKIDLIKKDGTRITDLNASVQGTMIYTDVGHLLIESGDIIQRRIPNGAEETYLVVDPGFSEAVGCVPANYQIEVRKMGI